MEPKPTPRDWLEWSTHGVGLVFADIIGSTAELYDRGTENYNSIIHVFRGRARELAAQFGGFVLSSEGDEVFAAFSTASGSCRFARGIFDDAGHPALMTRVGVHFGTINPDPFPVSPDSRPTGRTVHLAAKVMKRALSHELWVTDAVKQALERESASAAGIAWVASEQCVLGGVPLPQLLWRAA
jgi:class 3 adenylate cyclase